MDSCIFCKIVNGDIPANKVFEDDNVLAFLDVNPAAPNHVLIIPKTHVSNVLSLNDLGADCVSSIFNAIKIISNDLGILESGFRVVCNTGIDGGQTVSHLHFHLLGGRTFAWPPG